MQFGAFGQFFTSAAMMLGVTGSTAGDTVKAALKTRLPKTEVSAVNCDRAGDLCEVIAGQNLFYVDRSARYLVIGRVYDMQTRQDLTAARLLEMNPDMLVGGAAKANAASSGEPPAPGRATAETRVASIPQRVDLSSLSKKGAVVWGKGGPSLTVFSDVHCGYCRALAQSLAGMNVTIVERPISVLGSRDVANQVLCAPDKVRALHAAYAREPIANAGSCDTAGLDENETFARKHGFTGTPVVVLGDGTVLEGFGPNTRAQIAAWIKGAK